MLGVLAVILVPAAGFAQSGPTKAQPSQQESAADQAQNNQKEIDELAEAAKALSGAAGKAECVWLGRRVIILMWREDLDTAFRHLSLYDRFDCPGSHIQAAFRCLIKQGPINPKAPETLNSRAFGCWVHPEQMRRPTTAKNSAPSPTDAPSSR